MWHKLIFLSCLCQTGDNNESQPETWTLSRYIRAQETKRTMTQMGSRLIFIILIATCPKWKLTLTQLNSLTVFL